VANPHSSSTEANQAALVQRLRSDAQDAAKRADAIKQQVRLAKTILKRTRQLAKASKKAAKQARKKAKAAQEALQVRIRKSPSSRLSKPKRKPKAARATKASKPSTNSSRRTATPRRAAGSAAEAARSVIERLEGMLPRPPSALRQDVDQEPGK